MSWSLFCFLFTTSYFQFMVDVKNSLNMLKRYPYRTELFPARLCQTLRYLQWNLLSFQATNLTWSNRKEGHACFRWNISSFLAVFRIRIRIWTWDPHGFGPSGSGYIRQMYGSGSFYHQAKKSKKNLDSYCFATSFGLFYLLKLM